MTDKINDGGPAFPPAVADMQTLGMSLRDAFGIAALQGLCANPGGPFQANNQCGWALTNCTYDNVAAVAWEMANAMLRTRETTRHKE